MPPAPSLSSAEYRVSPADAAGFSTHCISPLKHNFHEHPLLQLPALGELAKYLAPLKQCRFVRPGITQASSFAHDGEHPDGKSIDEVFARIHEPYSWVALYNIEANPVYATLLAQIIDTVRPTIEREQPGIFLINGFMFLSAPPSVTPFHIDRENNFWLQLHGRKTMSVWDHTDRTVVEASAVEDFIITKSLRRVRLKEEYRARSHEFDTGPGDGIYFPSTSPHMTRSEPDWVKPGDGVSVSLGVTFYTSVTRRHAQVHQFNRLLRQTLKMTPTEPGMSTLRDSVKAPLGRMVGAAHYRRNGGTPPPGAY
ncbi:JmjC domain-containing protein [Variovorax sp. RT4R15]|uniref:JmjC domain-containing protein n=1 Tax=Variovorax sp. RT4R15 TaxID=3443737 RepID=UPI003F4836E8